MSSFDWSLSGPGDGNGGSDGGGASQRGSSAAQQLEDLRRKNRALAMERDDLLARVEDLERGGNGAAACSTSPDHSCAAVAVRPPHSQGRVHFAHFAETSSRRSSSSLQNLPTASTIAAIPCASFQMPFLSIQ